MSKNFGLPIQKGTEPLFDQVSQQPTKLVVEGVDAHTPEGQRVIARYSGVLRQFHAGQQQAYSLSNNRVHRASTNFGDDASATYVNIHGQETLTLRVNVTGGESQEAAVGDEYWSWAIVEVRVPNIQGLTSFVASAWMNPPPKNKQGYAINGTHPIDTDKPPLTFPVDAVQDNLGAFLGDVQDNDGYASLRVDLRPYPGGVKFDLYGYIRRYQDGTTSGPNTTSTKRAGQRPANVSSHSGTGAQTMVGVPLNWFSPSDISGRTINTIDLSNSTTLTNFNLDFPATTGLPTNSVFQSTINFLYGPVGATWGTVSGPSYGGLSFAWTPGSGNNPDPSTLNVGGLISAAGGVFTETTTFGADGIVKKIRGLGAMDYATRGGVDVALNGAGPTDADGNYGISFFDYSLWWVGDHPTVPNYIYPSRACPVSFTVLDDGPDAMTNRYGSPLHMNSFRWEASKKYPARWPMKVLPATANMQAVDDSGFPFPTKANHYAMIKLGTVIINPKKGKGGIKFTPA